MASTTPASPSLSSTWSSSARPATGTSGFGIRSVNGRMRTPRPAARTMARVGLTDIIRSFLELLLLDLQIISRRFAPRIAIVDALAAPCDDCATRMRRSDFLGMRRVAFRLFLLVVRPDETDADLVAVDPGQFAAAVGEAGR